MTYIYSHGMPRSLRARAHCDARSARAAKEVGLTLEEVEEAEGGVVRESAVGMAQTKRAVKRKGSRADKSGARGAEEL